MPKPQRFCIYCGGTGLTKEHLWADWLKAYIPRERLRHGYDQKVIFPGKVEREVTYKTGDTHSRTIRRVCRSCNGGWMSELQQAAKPILVPMLESADKVILHRKAQTILSAWVAMTVMTSEFASEKIDPAIPASERRFLMDRLKPPSNWRIFLACGETPPGKDDPTWTHNVMAVTTAKVEKPDLTRVHPPNTQTTTIRLGKHLVIHVMSSTHSLVSRRWKQPAALVPGLAQIWPVRDVRVAWPRKMKLTNAEILYLADNAIRRVHRVARKEAGLD